ncbi:MAG TPA: tRNA lysidine(34) synthetase TilS, partial [Bryobacteraceae bacterium]|nr:tRNA lysidine(34) synthetase TilS [Bryobacteraceae bacterium]
MMLLANDLVQRVSQIITRYSMLSPGDRVGVAVSGGADSVVLLHVLHRLGSNLALNLTVLHVNHQLRGGESESDEEFVRELAGGLGLPVVVKREKPCGGNLEQEARDIRREFFAHCRKERLLDRIALGHTRSDQAETVLYRFLRGSGLAGLAGIRPLTATGLIRPLLDLNRKEVRAWAAKEGLMWREDTTNTDTRFVRNMIRNSVLPELSREFNANLEGVLAGTADLAAAEEDYWSREIRALAGSLITPCDLGLLIPAKSLMKQHIAVQRRIVRHAIEQVKGDLRSIDLEHVDAVLNVCRTRHGHDRVIIPGVDAIRSFDVLLLTRPGQLNAGERQYSVELTWNQKIVLPFGAGKIELRALNQNYINCDTVKEDSHFTCEIADLSVEVLSALGTR